MPDGSGGLYIADASNNRVLYYPTGSILPTRVYGQADYISCGVPVPVFQPRGQHSSHRPQLSRGHHAGRAGEHRRGGRQQQPGARHTTFRDDGHHGTSHTRVRAKLSSPAGPGHQPPGGGKFCQRLLLVMSSFFWLVLFLVFSEILRTISCSVKFGFAVVHPATSNSLASKASIFSFARVITATMLEIICYCSGFKLPIAHGYRPLLLLCFSSLHLWTDKDFQASLGQRCVGGVQSRKNTKNIRQHGEDAIHTGQAVRSVWGKLAQMEWAVSLALCCSVRCAMRAGGSDAHAVYACLLVCVACACVCCRVS